MSTSHQRRVLLVEDDSTIHPTLTRRLKAEGYAVTLATNYADARHLLDTENYHVAVIDKRLDASDETNEDGVTLLEDVNALGLRGIMHCILLTAYGTLPLVLRSFEELGVDRFILKEPHYIAKLLDAVRETFETKVKIGFDLDYVGTAREFIEKGVNDIRAREDDIGWPASEPLIAQVYDLLGKLFNGAKRMYLKRMVKGLSGSIVLEAHPTWPTGLGRSHIVKIGRRDKTQTEETNYHKHVERFLPAHHATQLDAQYTRNLGALLYTLAEAEAADTMEFEVFYERKTSSEIVKALQGLLRNTCRLWYRSRTPPDHESLRDLYMEAFNLKHQPDRLANEIAAMHPDFQPRAPAIPFDPPGVALPNPLPWLEDGNASVLPVCRSITHGDLNARNILISEAGDCWLIDFYRTYHSHILRDFVVLETDIKFRLLGVLAIDVFYKFEQALVHLDDPERGLSLDSSWPDAAKKAAIVIAGLRAEAWGLLEQPGSRNLRQIQHEYLVSLLMATLNILRLRHFKSDPGLMPQRERALLSAALICQALR